MPTEQYQQVIDLIDQANSQDPNLETDEHGQEQAKELLYGLRMSDMIERFAADADEVNKIAVRAQHIERWKSPRSDYSMDRKGYLQWRTDLYQFHAETVAGLMARVGYDAESIERVKQAVGKKSIKKNPDTQMLESVAAMVFIEHYMQMFADKHPEYSEEKWIDIVQKTWRKMSEAAQQFTLAGKVKLPEPLVPLIQKSLGV